METSSHDFDFLFGRWRVLNRRLTQIFAGSTDWYEFEATVSEEPLLGGRGNLERYDAPHAPKGAIHAIAVRLHDAATGKWSISWASAGSGRFEPATIGTFEDGVGSFYADETWEEKPIGVRFLWTRAGTQACHWEQAFSADGGAHWETNWTMAFTRLE